MAALKQIICPECEGEGLQIDNFMIPEINRFDTPLTVPKPEKCNSAGIPYKNQNCIRCDGDGFIIVSYTGFRH